MGYLEKKDRWPEYSLSLFSACMQLLGHRNIKNTLKYTQLIGFQEDDYTCKVTNKPKEIKQLIEAGFEYVTEQDCLKFFRKRK